MVMCEWGGSGWGGSGFVEVVVVVQRSIARVRTRMCFVTHRSSLLAHRRVFCCTQFVVVCAHD
jgi:hypothetical protein